MKTVITSRDIKFYTLALKIADLSICQSKHGAIITDGSNIISISTNKRKTHPISFQYCQFINHSIHAEQGAIIKAHRNISGMSIYSAKANGNLKGCPCKMCLSLILEANIRTIVYFNGKELIKERL